jgi:hypothetical protein
MVIKSSRNGVATKNISFTPRFSAVITRTTEVKAFAAEEPSLTTSLKRGVDENRP